MIEKIPKVPKIGMRKFKTVLTVPVLFVIWQAVRYFIPSMDVHPVIAYLTAIVTMKNTIAEARFSGVKRLSATMVGLSCGLAAIFIDESLSGFLPPGAVSFIVQMLIISIGLICSLVIAEMANCMNFISTAATIFMLCVVDSTGVGKYAAALLRISQTALGFVVSYIVNRTIAPPEQGVTPFKDYDKDAPKNRETSGNQAQ